MAISRCCKRLLREHQHYFPAKTIENLIAARGRYTVCLNLFGGDVPLPPITYKWNNCTLHMKVCLNDPLTLRKNGKKNNDQLELVFHLDAVSSERLIVQ